MELRLAYTAGGMVLLTGDGTRRRLPAGACWIDRHAAASGACVVRWNELGIDYRAEMPGEDLRAYVLGCIVQYA